jgi:hypothetical protein
MVLKVLREHKLYAKLSKCIFYQKKIHYLGHIISADGITVDPEKIEAIRGWPNAKKCDRGQIIYGSCGLLLKIHKRVFKYCKPNHFFAKEGSEV